MNLKRKKILFISLSSLGGLYVIGTTISFLSVHIVRKDSGFKVPDDNNGVKSEIDKALESIEDNYKTSHSSTYIGASNLIISKEVSEEEIGIEKFETGEVNLKLRIKSRNVNLGSLIVQVTVEHNNTTKTKDITISGFQSEFDFLTNSANTSLSFINREVWAINDKDISTVNDISTTWTGIGMVKPSQFHSRFNVSFQKKEEDTELGDVTFDAILKYTMTNREEFELKREFTVKGFLVDNDDINYINQILKEIDSTFETSLQDTSATSIASVNDEVLIEDLGINIDEDHLDDFNVVCLVKNIDANNGTITISLSLEFNGVSNSKEIIVSGFN